MLKQRSSAVRLCRRLVTVVCAAVGISAMSLAGGCANYRTPGAAASFHAMGITPDEARMMTDVGIAEQLDRRPAASFPANVAAVRVQATGYRSYTAHGMGRGNFTVVSHRDVETDEDIERLASMPLVASLQSVSSVLLPDRLDSVWDLRRMAASLQSEMLFIYTFDTRFGSETVVPALGVITLGLFPSEQARVSSTVSGVLVDTRTGFVYGTVEATSSKTQAANKWTTREAIDQSRRRAEAEAFAKLVDRIEGMWTTVTSRYGPQHGDDPSASAPASVFESGQPRKVVPSSGE